MGVSEAVKFTPQQRDAIDAPIANLLVSAAAGSGKTAVLTERVIRLLTADPPVEANRLVIVTFTVLAAEEMRQRISRKLSALIAADPTNQLLQSQQLMLSSARICTIHSLCSGLIKDNFQSLGLSADFRVADETELAVIKQEAVEWVLGECYDEKAADFLELVEFTCVKNDKPLIELVLNIYDFIRSFPFPKGFLHDCLNSYAASTAITDSVWYNDIAAHADAALRYAIGIIDTALDRVEGDDKLKPAYSPALSSDRAQLYAILSALQNDEWDDAVERCRSFERVSLKAVRGYEDKDYLESIKQLRKLALSALDTIADRCLCSTTAEFTEDVGCLNPIAATLFDAVERVYDRIEATKQEQGVLDYADLEHFALKLLLREGTSDEPSGIALTLADTFDEIMVDECQDINGVQNLIFRLLSKGEQNIFMVGDVKQSIYRFRKAVPTLFIEKKRKFPIYTTGSRQGVITLQNNFRSRQEVCDTVNHVFSQLMTAEMGELDYTEDEYLRAGAVYQPHDGAQSEFHILDKGDNDAIEQEATYIAGMIHRMVQEGYPVEEKGSMRPCRYSDFAILLRAKKGKGELFTRALKRLAIDSYSDATDGYFSEYEIAVTLNLLRVIDNPLQDICMMSVLMSPMFGFDADRVAALRIADPKSPLYLALCGVAEQGDTACISVLYSIDELRRLAATCTVEELIQGIYDRTDFISLVYALGNGEQRDANLRLLLIYARQYEAFGSGGLSGFLRYIDRVLKTNRDFSCANTMTSGRNAIKIMSVHSSKGLEFPICIVADCAKGFNLMDINRSYQLNSRLGYGMKIVEKATLKKYANLPFEAVRLATLKETIAEEMRVLYVAMTRAREKLIMVMSLSNPDKKLAAVRELSNSGVSPYAVFLARSYADWLLMSAPYGSDSIKLVLPQCTSEEAVEAEQQLYHAEPPADLVSELLRTFAFSYPRNAFTTIPAKLTATQLSKQEAVSAIKLRINPSFLQQEGLTPAMKGTIHHSFMQYADFDNAAVDLEAEITRLVEHRFLMPNEAAALDRAKLRAFFTSSIYSDILTADEVYREYKFLHFIKADEVYTDVDMQGEGGSIMLQGIADCVLIRDGRITVIDYKTDATNDAALLAERYRTQLELYRQALSRAFALPVEHAVIYSLHAGITVEV